MGPPPVPMQQQQQRRGVQLEGSDDDDDEPVVILSSHANRMETDKNAARGPAPVSLRPWLRRPSFGE